MREETLILMALAVLALFLGLLVGGGFTYWYMPQRCSKVVETTGVEYQCYDGSKKADINNCPKPSIPQCAVPPTDNKSEGSGGVYRLPFDCSDCLQKCPQICSTLKPGETTTTTIPVVLIPCTTDSECGTKSILDYIKCAFDKGNRVMYKLSNEPFCNKGYCMTRQNRMIIRSCMDNERCVNGTGCMPYVEESE